MRYGEGQEGTGMIPGLLASAPGQIVVILTWGILNQDQVGGEGSEEDDEFEVLLKHHVSVRYMHLQLEER